jgi:hypothetical protein
VLETVGSLSEGDLGRTITVRAEPITVHEGLCRALAHAAYHVGQIVLLARLLAPGEWQWITMPKKK